MKPTTPKFEVGDEVDVHQRILEGNKERIQIFSGRVIAIRGTGMNLMFTVRRIVQGEGVERIFPIHSPKIAKVEVKRTGKVRRAKLYYLRSRVGKATRLKERALKGEALAAANAAAAAKKEAAAAKKEAQARKEAAAASKDAATPRRSRKAKAETPQ